MRLMGGRLRKKHHGRILDGRSIRDSFLQHTLIRRNRNFTNLKQGKMTANEYYRKFTYMSRCEAEIAVNPAEMLRRFKLGTKKKWRSMATILPCATYQEFYDVLLRIKDSDKIPSKREEEDEERGSNLKKFDKGKEQSSQGPRHTQSFKKSGTSSSSSSRGFSATGQRRVVNPLEDLASRCPESQVVQVLPCAVGATIDILESVVEGAADVIHVVTQNPQRLQQPQQPSLPLPVQTQQFSGPSSYILTGRGGAYHYQGDPIPYAPG